MGKKKSKPAPPEPPRTVSPSTTRHVHNLDDGGSQSSLNDHSSLKSHNSSRRGSDSKSESPPRNGSQTRAESRAGGRSRTDRSRDDRSTDKSRTNSRSYAESPRNGRTSTPLRKSKTRASRREHNGDYPDDSYEDDYRSPSENFFDDFPDDPDKYYPLPPPREHGPGCVVEIALLEKHSDHCKHKKQVNPMGDPEDDTHGNYFVVGRVAYHMCARPCGATETNPLALLSQQFINPPCDLCQGCRKPVEACRCPEICEDARNNFEMGYGGMPGGVCPSQFIRDQMNNQMGNENYEEPREVCGCPKHLGQTTEFSSNQADYNGQAQSNIYGQQSTYSRSAVAHKQPSFAPNAIQASMQYSFGGGRQPSMASRQYSLAGSRHFSRRPSEF